MAFHDVRLPVAVERGSRGGPRFFTTIIPLGNGHEQRNQNWQYPRLDYNIGYGIQRKAEMSEVLDFFWARHGMVHSFRFKDWADFEAPITVLGIGNAANKDFQAIRVYEPGTYQTSRKILLPYNITVYQAGVQTAAWSLQSGGIIRMNAAPAAGVEIAAKFEFDVPVRFNTDLMEMAVTHYNAQSVPNIMLIEVRSLL